MWVDCDIGPHRTKPSTVDFERVAKHCERVDREPLEGLGDSGDCLQGLAVLYCEPQRGNGPQYEPTNRLSGRAAHEDLSLSADTLIPCPALKSQTGWPNSSST